MYESFPYASQNAPTLKSNSDLGCISFMFFTIFIMLMFYSYYSSTKVVLVAYLLLNTDVGIQTMGRTAPE